MFITLFSNISSADLTVRRYHKKILLLLLILFLEIVLGLSVVFGCLDENYRKYLLAGVVGIILVFVSFIKPQFGYLLLVFLMPFRGESYVLLNISSAEVRIADVIAAPVFTGWLLSSAFIKEENPFLKSWIDTPLLAFALFNALSLSWGFARFSGVSKIIQTIYLFPLFYASIKLINSERFMRQVIIAWIVAGVAVALLGIYDAVSTPPAHREVGGHVTVLRTTSTETNALEFSEYLNYALMITTGLYITISRRLGKIVLFTAIVVMLVGTLSATSRGPIIGLFAGWLFFMYKSERFRKFLKVLAFILIIASVFGIGLGILIQFPFSRYIDTIIYKFSSMIEHPTSDPGIAFRLAIWSGVFKIIREYPILGIGAGSLPSVLPDYMMPGSDLGVAHNIYFEILVALGPIGFALFIWLAFRLGKIIFIALKTIKDGFYQTMIIAFAAALVAKAVGGLTWGFVIEDRALWLCIGLGLAIIRLAYQKQQLQSESI